MLSSRSKLSLPIDSAVYIYETLGTIAIDSKTRATYYVASVERLWGRTFGTKTHAAAMAAFSGLAITSSVAAKASSIGMPGPSASSPSAKAAPHEPAQATDGKDSQQTESKKRPEMPSRTTSQQSNLSKTSGEPIDVMEHTDLYESEHRQVLFLQERLDRALADSRNLNALLSDASARLQSRENDLINVQQELVECKRSLGSMAESFETRLEECNQSHRTSLARQGRTLGEKESELSTLKAIMTRTTEEQRSELETRLSSLRQEFEHQQASAQDKIKIQQDAIDATNTRTSDLQGELTILEEQSHERERQLRAAMESQAAAFKHIETTLQASVLSAREALESLSAELDAQKKLVQGREAELQAAEESIEHFRTEISRLSKEAQVRETSLMKASQEHETKLQEVEIAFDRRLEDSQMRESHRIAEAMQERKKVADSLERKTDENEMLSAKFVALNVKHNELSSEHEILLSKIKIDAEEAFTKHNLELKEKEDQIQELQTLRARELETFSSDVEKHVKALEVAQAQSQSRVDEVQNNRIATLKEQEKVISQLEAKMIAEREEVERLQVLHATIKAHQTQQIQRFHAQAEQDITTLKSQHATSLQALRDTLEQQQSLHHSEKQDREDSRMVELEHMQSGLKSKDEELRRLEQEHKIVLDRNESLGSHARSLQERLTEHTTSLQELSRRREDQESTHEKQIRVQAQQVTQLQEELEVLRSRAKPPQTASDNTSFTTERPGHAVRGPVEIDKFKLYSPPETTQSSPLVIASKNFSRRQPSQGQPSAFDDLLKGNDERGSRDLSGSSTLDQGQSPFREPPRRRSNSSAAKVHAITGDTAASEALAPAFLSVPPSPVASQQSFIAKGKEDKSLRGLIRRTSGRFKRSSLSSRSPSISSIKHSDRQN